MLRHIISTTLFCSLTTTSVFAMAQLPFMSEEKPPSVMYEFLARVLELQPYMVSSSRWADPAHQKEIQEDLNALAEKSKSLTEVHRLEVASFRPTASILIEDLGLTARAYAQGDKEFARRMMNTSLEACASCHAQVGNKSAASWNFEESSLRGSALERAEFLMATRQYEDAEATYRGLAEGTTTPEDPSEVGIAAERLFQIDLEIRSDLKAAESALKAIQENTRLPEDLKSKAKLWDQQLKNIQSKPTINPTEASSDEMLAYIKIFLKSLDAPTKSDDDLYIPSFYLSGLTYKFLQSHKEEPSHAPILYALGSLELRQHRETGLANLGSLYFRECVYRYAQSPWAKQCFATYQDILETEFTGSSGLNLPDDIQQELATMKSHIAKAQQNDKEKK